jgi:tetratricopeptide (TPR) repeat protein
MNRLIPVVSILFALLAGCAAPPSGPRIDNVPMYGQPDIPRPDFLKQADADFIAKAASGFGGDRKAASRAWAEEGARYLAQKDLDHAMRRYNQAWLLDDSNYEAYWGFGRVMVEASHFDDGVKFTKQAVELCHDAFQLPAVYSDLGVAYSYSADALPADRAAERSAAFASANEAFSRSVELDPKYGNAWRRWTISLAMERRYSEAAEKAKRARELGAPPIPFHILQEIEDATAAGK